MYWAPTRLEEQLQGAPTLGTGQYRVVVTWEWEVGSVLKSGGWVWISALPITSYVTLDSELTSHNSVSSSVIWGYWHPVTQWSVRTELTEACHAQCTVTIIFVITTGPTPLPALYPHYKPAQKGCSHFLQIRKEKLKVECMFASKLHTPSLVTSILCPCKHSKSNTPICSHLWVLGLL